VQLLPDPPSVPWNEGAIAQLGERLLCKQEVIGSIPIGSTTGRYACSTCRTEQHSFHHLAKAPGVLFKNPEVLF
jgi:hypothetical protein